MKRLKNSLHREQFLRKQGPSILTMAFRGVRSFVHAKIGSDNSLYPNKGSCLVGRSLCLVHADRALVFPLSLTLSSKIVHPSSIRTVPYLEAFESQMVTDRTS